MKEINKPCFVDKETVEKLKKAKAKSINNGNKILKDAD